MSSQSRLNETLQIRVVDAPEGLTVCHIQGDAYSHHAPRPLSQKLGEIPGATVVLSPVYIPVAITMIVLEIQSFAVLHDVVDRMLRLILQHSEPMNDVWVTATVMDFVGKTGDGPREFALALCDRATGQFVEAPTKEGLDELLEAEDQEG